MEVARKVLEYSYEIVSVKRVYDFSFILVLVLFILRQKVRP